VIQPIGTSSPLLSMEKRRLSGFLVHKGKPFLRAENSKYPDLIPAHELVIQGVFRALLRVDKRRL
jgi:hypothetical protein